MKNKLSEDKQASGSSEEKDEVTLTLKNTTTVTSPIKVKILIVSKGANVVTKASLEVDQIFIHPDASLTLADNTTLEGKPGVVTTYKPQEEGTGFIAVSEEEIATDEAEGSSSDASSLDEETVSAEASHPIHLNTAPHGSANGLDSDFYSEGIEGM